MGTELKPPIKNYIGYIYFVCIKAKYSTLMFIASPDTNTIISVVVVDYFMLLTGWLTLKFVSDQKGSLSAELQAAFMNI